MLVEQGPRIERHKTAIRRNQISRPVRTAIRDGLLTMDSSFFDYGCGLGEDVEFLKGLGFVAAGWDPVHYPIGVTEPADIVNLGYVINVIEHEDERRETLRKAHQLARKAIVVSAQVGFFDVSRAQMYRDGFISSRNTFQKYFEQDELGEFIRSTLNVEPYPAGTGVYYVFSNAELEQDYCRKLLSDDFVGEFIHLQPLAEETLRAIADLVHKWGRLPLVEEAPEHGPALAILASSENWMRRLRRFLEPSRWEEIQQQRRWILLVKLAASNFALTGRQRMSDLSSPEKADIRSLFGSYSRALEEADRLIDETLRLDRVKEWLKDWGRGKHTREAVYAHTSLEPTLSDNLTLLVACARAAAAEELGDEQPTLVKFSVDELSVSFAYYPAFDELAHPTLRRVVRVDFETGAVLERSYEAATSPPILHRKELLVGADYLHRERFRRLTHQEQAAGLLGRTDIGSRAAWEKLLADKRLHIDDHRLLGNDGSLVDNGEEADLPLWESEEDDAIESERRLRNARRRRKLAAARPRNFTEAELSALGEVVMSLGRLPLVGECSLPKKRYELFVRTKRWREHLNNWFKEDTFQQSRRRLWEDLILDLGTSLFRPGGRPNFKKWSEERQWSIRSLFGSFAQATAEADSWMRRMGDATYIEMELINCGLGSLHEEKGLYVACSLEHKLPLVLRLLIRTATLFGVHAMPKATHVVRIARQGDVIKFYEYENFDSGEDSRRLQTCKVMFRRRKVLANSYEGMPRAKLLTSEQKGQICSIDVASLRE